MDDLKGMGFSVVSHVKLALANSYPGSLSRPVVGRQFLLLPMQ